MLATVGYGMFVAPRRIEVTEHDVALAGLPRELDGLRVVQITDLHFGPLCAAAGARRIAARTNACRPDLVVLTGDFVSYKCMRWVPPAIRELSALHASLGVHACLGNHDHWEGAEVIRRALAAAGIPVLTNANLRLAPGLWLAAVDDLMSGVPDLGKTTRGIPAEEAVVLLSHNPMVLPEVAGRPWLVLAGHTHGGQIALPFVGPRHTAGLPGIRWVSQQYESLGARTHGGRLDAVSTSLYPEGWYTRGRARMYVSRGTGTSQTIPLRLNCRPEVACFTLRACAESVTSDQ